MRLFVWLSLTLMLAAGAPAVKAHSWYEWECCSAQDCWPMGVDADAKEPEPKVVPGGYLLHDGIFIAERNTRPSRDGRFHVCRYGGSKSAAVIAPTGKQICLYVPQPTF